ncbi:MAG: nucleotidyltransferase family protein [Candidatus Lambdaproteobacteria bacterium]|nr:nucleotidyltransferase family protein [Candidatus Lambdaproteobacteria bacterium]
MDDIGELLRSRRAEILRVAEAHGAANVRVFGSVARGEATDASDIDLLVEMKPGHGLLDLAALTLSLRDLLGRPVDVVNADGLYWLLRRRILREARPL